MTREVFSLTLQAFDLSVKLFLEASHHSRQVLPNPKHSIHKAQLRKLFSVNWDLFGYIFGYT